MTDDSTADAPTPETGPDWASFAFAAGLVALLASVVFAGLWLAPGQWFPSHPNGDTIRSFVYLRSFGYAELAHGQIPLWNPYTFSGTPFLGSFQSAILYPLNLHYLVLPLAASISLEFIVHQALLAGFTSMWIRSRGCSREAAILGGVVIALAAPTSLRVLAGQLSVLDTYAWWPLLLLAVDRLLARRSLGWTLAGIAAVSMMILAGHPPTVWMAGVATGVWVVLSLPGRDRPVARLLRLVPVAVAPLLLTAAQLWPGLHTASESLRSGGMNYAFATSHSFPPLHLLTLLVPELFGQSDFFNLSYFGKVYFWDATAYMGIAGVLLAMLGLLHFREERRTRELAAWVFLTLLAFGSFTPVYRALYDWLPGFDVIRAPSKFYFFATVFGALFAAVGFDVARRGTRETGETRSLRGLRAVALACAVACGAFALWLWWTPADGDAPGAALALLERAVGERSFAADGEPAFWHALALRGSLLAAVLVVLSLGLIEQASHSAYARHALVGLLCLDLLCFAWMNQGGAIMSHDFDGKIFRVSAKPAYASPRLLRTSRPDVHMVHDNYELGIRRFDVWGYDPVVLQRYARFVAFTQDIDLASVEMPSLLQIERTHPLLRVLRVGTRLDWSTREFTPVSGALPRFFFVRDAIVVSDQDAAHAAMSAPGFDPARSVVLETDVAPELVAALVPAPGPVRARDLRLLGESTDHVELELALDSPAVLVMTDAYSRGWRAVALEGSSQTDYELLPADAAIRAVPLAAGRHRLRIEYAPLAWRAGRIVSLVSLTLFGVAVAWAVRGHRRRRRVHAANDGAPPASEGAPMHPLARSGADA